MVNRANNAISHHSVTTKSMTDLLVNNDGSRLYLVGLKRPYDLYDPKSRVTTLDGWSGSELAAGDLPEYAADADINASGSRLYATSPDSGKVMVVDTATATLVHTLSVISPLWVSVGPGQPIAGMQATAVEYLSVTCFNDDTGARAEMTAEAEGREPQTLSVDCDAAGLEYAPGDAISISAEGRRFGEGRR
jgi:DNA-binding beta-propeller fold protein YncE